MSDLRKAAQMALEALIGAGDDMDVAMQDAFVALRAALAQPEPEPVAWLPSAEWTACIKLPVVVHVRSQRTDEAHVSTREGITPVKPDDLIMRGVSGEEYPIGREIFERTYRFGDAPPSPQRKPLTEEEIRDLWSWAMTAEAERTATTQQHAFARAIERAHEIGVTHEY